MNDAAAQYPESAVETLGGADASEASNDDVPGDDDSGEGETEASDESETSDDAPDED